MKNKKCGSFKDKADKRDYIYQPSGASPPPTLLKHFQLVKVAIKDQGTVNSCVAHAIATIKEIQEYYEGGNLLSFSTGWIYGFRDNGQYKGEGMYPREALNNLIKYGDVLHIDFPENKEYQDLQPLIQKRKSQCLTKGKIYKCKAYAKVTNNNDVKNCLYKQHSPILLNCRIYPEFYEIKKDGKVPATSKYSDYTFHAMTIVGWKNDDWIVQNSWGKEFGDKGYCYIKMNSVLIEDLYTITDIQNVKR